MKTYSYEIRINGEVVHTGEVKAHDKPRAINEMKRQGRMLGYKSRYINFNNLPFERAELPKYERQEMVDLSNKNGFHVERLGRRPFDETAEYKKLVQKKKGMKWFNNHYDTFKRVLKKDSLIDVVKLYHAQKRPMEEVGKILGVSKNAISSRNRTIKNKFEKNLTPKEYQEIMEFIDPTIKPEKPFKERPDYLDGYENYGNTFKNL